MPAYMGATRNSKTGKRPVRFAPRDVLTGPGFDGLLLPCGQCMGCRLSYSRNWAMRCMHEASLYSSNCFVTLTYDDEHLPAYGSLRKVDFQLFMKRLRKSVAPEKVRYFYAGEYGERYGRPHYHALLFGFDFPDKYEWTRRGDLPVFRSSELERLWPHGVSELGSVTYDSAAYVARYVTKKVVGRNWEVAYQFVDEDGVVQCLEREYADMSRGKGIGREWFLKYRSEIYRHDSVVVNGREVRPPRYYDLARAEIDPDGAAATCSARRRLAFSRKSDNTVERLDVKEECAIARTKVFQRKVD